MPAYQPEALHALFVDAFNRADADGLADLYQANAVLATRAGRAVGRHAIRQAYVDILASAGRMELETLAVLASGDGLALLHSAWAIHSDGNTTSGISTEVALRQSNGTWLFILDEPRTPGFAGSSSHLS
jgi:uncharacterized protein (TIGR02246 family)